jgi:hypothetical protein
MKLYVNWKNLTLLKQLKLKYNLFMMPVYILRLPFILTPIMFEGLSNICYWIHEKLFDFYDVIYKITEPPKWYIANKYLNEAREYQEKLQQEERKRLLTKLTHNIDK